MLSHATKEHDGFRYAFSTDKHNVATERWVLQPGMVKDAYKYLEDRGLTPDVVDVTSASFLTTQGLSSESIIITGLGFEAPKRSEYVREILSVAMKKAVVFIEDPGYALSEDDCAIRYGAFLAKQISRFKKFEEEE